MKEDTPKLRGICLDANYSGALWNACHQSGYLVFNNEESREVYNNPKERAFLMRSRSVGHLRDHALETAAIFDEVNLFGLPIGFDIKASCAKL
jgi:hypothetical protein